MRPRIKYCGRLWDVSGYGEHARCFIAALHRCGVPLSVQNVDYGERRPDLGAVGELLRKLENGASGCEVKLIHLTPDEFPRMREAGCVNIGYTTAETDRLLDSWVAWCNGLDGVIVPSRWNREVFERSGVRVPVRTALPPVDCMDVWAEKERQLAPRFRFQELREYPRLLAAARWLPAVRWFSCWFLQRRRCWDGGFGPHEGAFKFYSVFHWSERKNPVGLLQAYFAEFYKDDGVCLVLKTAAGIHDAWDVRRIRAEIADVKVSMRLPRYPPVLLLRQTLARREMRQLHHACDCFVLPHRGEGFGFPLIEAMACGKPVITTRYSSNLEFTLPEHAMLLPYQLRPVAGMAWLPWLEGDMMWAEPDLAALRRSMRKVYEDRAWAAALGRRGQEFVLQNFDWRTRAEGLLQAIDEIIASSKDTASSPPAG
jgi:glycosyltransferase involved in cell wall biosynthesis